MSEILPPLPTSDVFSSAFEAHACFSGGGGGIVTIAEAGSRFLKHPFNLLMSLS